GKPLTELEVLRREVQILKLQMEVLQTKVLTQEADLRALQGEASAKAAVRDYQRALNLGYQRALHQIAAGPDPGRRAEAALKALREAKDDVARKRALDALEGALRQLRQQIRPGPAADVPDSDSLKGAAPSVRPRSNPPAPR